MSFLVTPRQFAQRAEFYHQLGRLTSAGLALSRALEQIHRHPPSREFRAPLQQLCSELAQGRTFADSLRQLPDWLPEFDIALLDAGERSGRMDAGCRMLATYYQNRSRMTQQVISQLIYPVGVVHLAALVFFVVIPFAGSQFHSNLPLLLIKAGLVLAPFYAAVGLIIFGTHGKHGEKWRALIESLLHWVPLLGAARHCLALARLSAALDALLNAGVNIVQAWDFAARASGSPALNRAVAAMQPEINAGQTPAETLSAHAVFPELFTNLYAGGEVGGRLDEALQHLYEHYQTEGLAKLETLANWLPRVIYGLVVLLVAYGLIRFWGAYVKQISALTN